MEDAIEFYAAAVPLENDGYQQAIKKLSKIFDGRKALRNFEQTPYKVDKYKSYNKNLKSSLESKSS